MTEAATSAPAESAAPAMPESFSSVAEAARFLTAEREAADKAPPAKVKTESPPDADADDGAPGEHELSDEDNAALGKDQAHGEDEDADPEDEDLPPIARPKSWGKEDQAEWDALSRSQQEKIAARETSRDKAIRQAQNDAAEQSKATKAKEEAAETARTGYEQKARDALEILAREQQRDFADIKTAQDVSKLAHTDPLRFVQWQAHQAELAAIKDAVDAADKAKVEAQKAKRSTYQTQQRVKLNELVPAFADDKAYREAWERAVSDLDTLGLPTKALDRLANTEDGSEILFSAAFQKLVADSQELAKMKAARSAMIRKDIPNVQRPGGRQPQGNANSERIKALTTTFNNNPTLKNAAALQVAQRNARTRRAG